MRLYTVIVGTLANTPTYIGSTRVLAGSERNARVMGRDAVLRTAGLPAGTCVQVLVR